MKPYSTIYYNMMKQLESKISIEQKKVIIEYMERNPDFAQETSLRTKNGPNHNELWNKLTQILNKTPGHKKDRIKWQKAWTGIKKAIKMKLKRIQIYQDNTTGHCIFYPRLTEMDERVISIMKNKSAQNKEIYLNLEKNRSLINETSEKGLANMTNVAIKKENSQTNEENMNISHLSPVTPVLKEQLFPSDDEENSETTSEECSNVSWNSHDNRSVNEKVIHSKILKEKIDAVSLQLEQLIEQNSVTNILLERIATTLEKRSM